MDITWLRRTEYAKSEFGICSGFLNRLSSVRGEHYSRLSGKRTVIRLFRWRQTAFHHRIGTRPTGKLISPAKAPAVAEEEAGVLSPNRRFVARLSGRKDKRTITVRESETGLVQSIWTVDQPFKPLTHNWWPHESQLNFSWSPDSSRLAIPFASDTDEGLDIWDAARTTRSRGGSVPKFIRTGMICTIPSGRQTDAALRLLVGEMWAKTAAVNTHRTYTYRR